MVIGLGIESTAHTFGASVVNDKGKILSNVNKMFTTEKEGMNPSDVAKHHRKYADEIIKKALDEAKIKETNLDFITFSQGPGLPPSLVVGKDKAKELANKLQIPLIGSNHICAHLEIGKLLTKTKDPVFVFVSGANTQIIAYESKRYRIFGETLDIGLGNAFDKFGRDIGLGFPAGPQIEKLAKNGNYIELPYIVKGMDLSFSGIITRADQLYKQGKNKDDLCYSLQETCFAMLTEVSERALAHCNKKEVILIGGVAANKRFCEMLDKMCKRRKAKFFPVPLKHCGDHAAMIAWQGMLQFKSDKNFLDLNEIDILPKWRIDEVEVTWIK
ncbi:MAG: bifunctional N(6)-L-threonylcarbamoyladenine synthase/serine/threonine protein kinase [Candidatus Nanoarchaeia archaeon]|nr:bifunctional N(6)-L-threonylcarbamoyladenine synthase/serine/threonine protein kinase [Candidatus Nanoarchaeia archaeon]